MERIVAERLFFAVWPDTATRAALRASTPPRMRGSGRPTPEEKLHLTVLFLGQMTPAARRCVESAADAVDCQAFTMKLTRIGYFPRSRVLWAGMSEVPESLAALHEALRNGARSCGCEIETHAYAPHITLMRDAPGHFPAPERVDIPWHVRFFALVASRTRPGGTHYETLRTWPLR
ncbi:MAG: RNA 2',3'-cyclic phosphodiesterase [Gammaproteobacteria bacterium]|nr:RNA 2',3'-cyclic phosphodiesterase [Gammaproteobacteria bacterium]